MNKISYRNPKFANVWKLIIITVLMVASALSSMAQLSYRTLSDTVIFRRNYISYNELGFVGFQSQRGQNNSLLINYISLWQYEGAYPSKNFLVREAGQKHFSAVEGYSYLESPLKRKVEEWQNNYFMLPNAGIFANNFRNVNLYFYDKNFRLQRRVNDAPLHSVKSLPTSDGGILTASRDSLIKLDASLRPLWRFKFAISDSLGGGYSFSGGYYIGMKEYDDFYLISLVGPRTHVFRFTKSGQLLHSFQAPTLLREGSFSARNNKVDYYAPEPYDFYHAQDGVVIVNDTLVAKYNFNGQPMWKIPYEQHITYWWTPFDAFQKTSNNTFIIRRFQGHFEDQYTFIEEKAQYSQYDLNGQLLWETPYLEEFAFTYGQPTPDGGFMTETNPRFNSYVPITSKTLRWYNNQGQKIKERTFQVQNAQFISKNLTYQPDETLELINGGYLEIMTKDFNTQWKFPKSDSATTLHIMRTFSNGNRLLSYTVQNEANRRVALLDYNGNILLDASKTDAYLDNISRWMPYQSSSYRYFDNNLFETNEGHLLLAVKDYLYRLDKQGNIVRKIALNCLGDSFMYDEDGRLVGLEYRALDGVQKAAYSLVKLAEEDKVLWRIALPVYEDDGLIYCAYKHLFSDKKDTYSLIVHKSFKEIPVNDPRYSFYLHDQLNLLTITRPCHENPEGILNVSTNISCETDPVRLSSQSDSLGRLSFEWKRNGATISTTHTSDFETSGPGTYQVVVQDAVCNKSSLSKEVIVQPRMEVIIVPQKSTDPQLHEKIKLLVPAKQGATYQWYKDDKPIDGATASIYEASENGNYTVRVYQNGCSQLSYPIQLTILLNSAEEPLTADEIVIYPNPSQGLFEVRTPHSRTIAEINLYDMAGRELPLQRLDKQIQAQVPAGSYWVKVRVQDKTLVKRLVVIP